MEEGFAAEAGARARTPGSVAADLWAKPPTALTGRPFPLLAHLLDTGAVLQAYLGDRVAPRQLEVMADLCGLRDSAEVPRSLAHLAALHDVGKATPYFQEKLGNDLDARLPSKLVEDVTANDRDVLSKHATASGLAVLRRTGQGNRSVDVLAGHHGTFDSDVSQFEPEPVRFGRKPLLTGCRSLWHSDSPPSDWVRAWEEIMATCARVFGERLPTIDAVAPVPFACQLVVLADWIASSETFLASAPLNTLDHPDEYVHRRTEQARAELTKRFGDPPPDTAGRRFAELFPGVASEPNALQSIVAELPRSSGLTLVAAPMGSGKTEAALLRALQGSAGFYFALPTGATAKAMFERVRGFLDAVAPGNQIAGNVLFHSAATEEFYVEPSSDLASETTRSDAETVVVASEWLQGRHLALLAPVGAGTVDRILHGVMPHRYGFLKLGALAGRTVILDEVHAYDAYTSELIARLVEWLAFGGSDVVLLSATLPTPVTRRLTRAWQRGVRARSDAAAEGDGIPEVEPPAYPFVLHATDDPSDDPTTRTVEWSSYELELEHFDASTAEDFASTVEEILDDREPCHLAVIVNTVRLAQELAATLRDRVPGADLHVLHSRMTAAQRRSATEEVERRFGRKRPDHPDRHQLLVSTQVAEMSLDLDADVMVSQLAPIASLLQRSGRLWRHHRPSRTGRRVLWVSRFREGPDHQLLPYGEAPLRRTWERVLDRGGRRRIRIPDQVQELVDAGFDAEGLEKLGQSVAEEKARLVSLPSPAGIASVRQLTEGTDELPDLLTRLGADSEQVLVVGEAAFAWRGELPTFAERRTETAAQRRERLATYRRLLDCTVPIPVVGRGAQLLKLCSDPPEAWTRRDHPLLSHLKVLDLESCTGRVVLDDLLGLVHTTTTAGDADGE